MKSISDHETKMNERIKENNTKHEEMQNRINILLHRKFVLEQEIKETLRHQETLSADIESESRMIAQQNELMKKEQLEQDERIKAQ